MCLAKLKNLNNHKYTYVQKKFWKVVVPNKRFETLDSPFFTQEWKVGWNKSNNIKQNSVYVDNSIHVFTKRKKAQEMADRNGWLVIPVYADGKDLIAYGANKHAAFSKVYFKKEDYDKCIKFAKD